MKASFYTEYGSPNELQIKEVPKPIPKENEVLVQVYAASINSWDWDLLRGKPYIVRLLFGALKKPKLQTLGADIAGTVVELGSQINDLQIGEEVFGDLCANGWSGFAEYVCVPEKVLTKKPAEISFEQAASLPQAGVMALQSLCDKQELKPGQKVLINGAGGGVGTIAIQIAKYYEVEITAVDSTQKLEKMQSLGADFVIDYTSKDFTKNGLQYDLIIDVVANRSIFEYQRSLVKNGRFIMVGGTTSTILQTVFIAPLLSLFGSKKLGILAHEPNKNLNTLLSFIKKGILVPIIDSSYYLDDIQKAFEHFGSGNVKGKIIIKIKS